ncbi:MAG TPA: phosphoribosylglycinamide formyltransferase, partial [Candidatus Kapabacteria bacterium]|nr:phosphoribosylglycinamide formyltransferase [Candidatus Kapabacteria bacterium]
IFDGRLLGAELALVLSNNSTSGALEYAKQHGLAAQHCSVASCGGDTERFERDLMDEMDANNIEIIALAGYLKKLPDSFVDRFEYRIVNVHPALLPSFGGSAMYGIRVHEAVLARGCKVSGASVHFVTREYDAGPIILQKCCPVKEGDTPQTLQHRVRNIEFEIFPRAIGLLAQDKLIVENNRVHILP